MRSRLAAAALSTALGMGIASSPAPVSAAAERDPVAYAIGDSVLLGARNELHRIGVLVDAVEGRQPRRLRAAVEALPPDGRPVIIHLGTNGLFDRQTCRDLVDSVDGERDVLLISVRAPRAWVRSSNNTIRACINQFRRSQVELMPWHRIAGIHSNLLYSDGIHLRPAGVDVFVDQIQQRLGLCQESKARLSAQIVRPSGHACSQAVSSPSYRARSLP